MTANGRRVCTWYIRHVNMFRSLAPREADGLALAMAPQRFAQGAHIVDRQTRPELVCLIRAGTVRLYHPGSDGRETSVEYLNSGHLFGVTALLTMDAGGLMAEAETDAEVCILDGGRFFEVVSRWPTALLELAIRLGIRVHQADETLARMSATGSRARLAAVLYRLARDATDTHPGGGLRLRGVPRHAELADEIGATRETVTRMLARLESDGYIRRFGRQIVIPDVARIADDFDLSS